MNRSIGHARGRTLTAFLAIVVMVAGLLSMGVTTAQAADSGTISGKVTKAGGTGLANINVTAYEEITVRGETYWSGVGSTTTASDGTYSVIALNPGTYRIGFADFEAGNYVSEYYDNTDTVDDAADVLVGSGETVAGKDAELAVGGHITGKVTKSGGTGLANAYVRTYQQVEDGDGEIYWEEFEDPETTRSDGVYRLDRLPAGTYRIGFDDFERGSYAGEYYNNKASIEDAADIVVAAGATVSGKNAELAPAAHITGKVTKPGGTGLGGIYVAAYVLVDHGDGESEWQEVTYSGTRSDGTFNVGGLSAGTYRIGFDAGDGSRVSEYYNNKGQIETAANITVAAGATASGKNAELAAAAHITGKVTAPGGAGLEEIKVSAYQLVNDPRGAYWDQIMSGETGTGGSYNLGGLKAGTYRIGFDDHNQDVFASEYFDNKATVEDAANVVVTAGATVANKNAELAPAGHITGTVSEGVGTGLADIVVLAYAKLGDGSWEEVDGIYTEPDGSYDIGGLPGGTYRIGFIDYDNGNYATEYFDNKARLHEAADIVVAPGATVAGKDAELDGAAHITGKVTKPGGAGIPDVDVVAYELLPDDDGGDSWQEVGFGFTNGDGTYDVGGLPAGTYRVGFEDLENEAYKTEYFDDKKTVGEAADIVLGGGATVSDTDAELALDLPEVANTVAPTVTGTSQVGQTLTAKAGTWTPTGVTFKYQWRADGAEISGATATTYKPVAGDVGKKISVAVTGARTGHTSTSKTSAETAKVSALLATPKNHRSTAQTSSSLTLAWDAVPGAPKYRVQFSKNSDMSSPTYLPFDTNGGTVTGLAAKTRYYFKVSVVDENNSARLTPYTATPASASTKPYEFATPAGLKSTAKSSTSLTLAWNAVAGAPSYRVQVSKSSTMSSPTYVAFDSNSGTVSGLTPNTKYYFKVSVTNADHSIRMSSYTSTPAYATTKLYDFTPPAHITSTDQTSTSLSLAWDAPGGAPGYRIQISKNSDMSSAFYRAFEYNEGEVTGLAPNTLYYFRVAVAKADDSARLSDYSAKPAPSARTKVAVP